ncbi:MAG: hypothetical protein ACLFWL_02310 [Candidatus Brocadiia bacterium]
MYRSYYSQQRDPNTHSSYHNWLVKKGMEPTETHPDGFPRFSRATSARLPEELSKTAFQAEEASQFIRKNAGSPWILHVNFLPPHAPFFGPRDDEHPREEVHLPENLEAPVLETNWESARGYFRDLFGDIPVLYFNGTSGDISLENQLTKHYHPETNEQKMARAAHLVTGETLRLLHETPFSEELRINCAHKELAVPIRLPSEDRMAWARERLDNARANGELNLEVATAYQMKVLHDRFAADPVEAVDIHVGSIGDLAFVTAPCELFTRFGKHIKARSPFEHTAIFGHVNGLMGYCPTTAGIIGGHWGGDPMYGCRWEETTGYRLVDEASALLYSLR